MPQAAQARVKAAAKPKPKPKPEVKSQSAKASRPPTRSELIRGVFDTFDRDCDDVLNPQELRRFADSVGFEGDEQDWMAWYRETCAEVGADRKRGVDRAQFIKLVQDAEDSELLRLCWRQRPQAATQHALTLRAVFDVFDRDCDGLLNRVELRRFMDNLDFEGDDIEWDEKYFRECKEVGANPQLGVDRTQFCDIAHRACTDAELDMLLQELNAMSEKPIALDVWSHIQPRAKNGHADDEDAMKPGEDLVQSREPPPPDLSYEGIPMAPERGAKVPASSWKEANSVAKLDGGEFELDHLRKMLVSQKDPKLSARIR
mmetsp:Transcript_11122/g.29561  ORF Transcript_11122/g.29561 Transcript_11122/m.29561 type:complete len:316 (+) Transcript_11122:52-999(+)